MFAKLEIVHALAARRPQLIQIALSVEACSNAILGYGTGIGIEAQRNIRATDAVDEYMSPNAGFHSRGSAFEQEAP